MTATSPVEREVPELVWTPHPLIPFPPQAAMEELARDEQGRVVLEDIRRKREEAIFNASEHGDPYYYEPEPEIWKKADALLTPQSLFCYILGGNRGSKSRYAAKRVVQAAMKHPGTVIFCVTEGEEKSIRTQQAYVWHYLPKHIKALGLSGRRDPAKVYYVNYSLIGGFVDRKLALPNGSVILFRTYNQEAEAVLGGDEMGNRNVLTVGFWPDENMPLSWLVVTQRRLRFRRAHMLWTYTPVDGMTPAILQAVGTTAKTIESRPAELLPDSVNVPGLPVGHMPVVQEPSGGGKVIYFWTEFSPFRPGPGSPTYYESVKEDCRGKTREYTMNIAYGYCASGSRRRFPAFCEHHIVQPEQLPAEGTNYMFIDPATSRNPCVVWVRVSNTNPPCLYFYRDWPDKRTYGEWAVPTSKVVSEASKVGWDGDRGMAQNTVLGKGVEGIKEMILACERVGFDALGNHRAVERDPYRRRLFEKSKSEAVVREEIFMRFADSRAIENPQAQQTGTTTPTQMFAEQRVNSQTGKVEVARMDIYPTRGLDTQQGELAVSSYLSDGWRPLEPFCWGINQPRLFVSAECEQLIWALENFTGLSGPRGASKDFIDLACYACTQGLVYMNPERPAGRGGGGCY